MAIGSMGALAAPLERADAVDKLMAALHERGQFNGAILVSQQGDVLYRKGFGEADTRTGTAFTPETLSDTGSVTKQFTAMAIMMLAERGRVGYDDLISKSLVSSCAGAESVLSTGTEGPSTGHCPLMDWDRAICPYKR